MNNFDNGLTAAQEERLYLLVEEAGEVIQAAMKILRHGLASCNPLIENGPTNLETLECELGHLMTSIGRLAHSGDVNVAEMEHHAAEKHKTGGRWLHHQDDVQDQDVS